MGSSGTGKFGNYTGAKNEENKCVEDFYDINLEEVAISDFYTSLKTLPDVGSKVYLFEKLHNKRLAIKDSKKDLIIGYLPIEYNYLYTNCILNKGYSYDGQVIFSNDLPIINVVVELNGKK